MNFKIQEETTDRLFLKIDRGSKDVRNEIIRHIRSARRENINLIISSVEFQEQYLILEFIKEVFRGKKKFLRKWSPQRITFVETLYFLESADKIVRKIKRKVNSFYKSKYEVEVVSQSMIEGDDEILVILLAKKIK